VRVLSIWELEGKERLGIDVKSTEEFIRSIRGIHKIELDQLMVDYITDNKLEFKDIETIRLFVKYLKEN